MADPTTPTPDVAQPPAGGDAVDAQADALSERLNEGVRVDNDLAGLGTREEASDEDHQAELVKKFLQGDPFPDEGRETSEPSKQTEGEKEDKGQETKSSEAPSSKPETEPTASPPEAPTESERLSALLQQQQKQIEALTNALQATARREEAPKQRDSSDKLAAEVARIQGLYSFKLPKDVVDQLGAEDSSTRSEAMTQLLSGVATAAHLQVMQEVEARLNQMQQQLPQTIAQNVEGRSLRDNIRQDFYSAYPTFNVPQLHPIVSQAAAEVFRSSGASHWTPDLRDAIARRVQETIQGIAAVGKPAQVPNTATSPQTVSKPMAFGTTTRPNGKSKADRLQEEILQVFSS